MPETATGETAQRKTDRQVIQEAADFQAGFVCQRCGKCCQEGVGIALWPHEFNRLRKLTRHLYRQITMINQWHVLKMPCIFYSARRKKCKIYQHRPVACRLYPMAVNWDGSTKLSPNCTAIKHKEECNVSAREAS